MFTVVVLKCKMTGKPIRGGGGGNILPVMPSEKNHVSCFMSGY